MEVFAYSDTNNLDIYLKEVRRYKLLTPEEEHDLAIRSRGDYVVLANEAFVFYATLSNFNLSEAEQLKLNSELILRQKEREEARETLINANLRLVLKRAHKYIYAAGGRSALPELVQEGNQGLITAVENFDPDRGTKLSTYATWWINQKITRAISDNATGKRPYRVPVHVTEMGTKISRYESRFFVRNGRLPSYEEIEKSLGINPSENEGNLGAREIKEASIAIPEQIEQFGEERGEFTLLSDSLEDRSQREYNIAKLNGLLSLLDSQRTIAILRYRWGLDDGVERTLEEVGREFNLTRERIRQIEKKALSELRRYNLDEKE